MNRFFAVVVALTLLLWGHCARSQPINLADVQVGAIGGFIHFLQEPAEPLGLSDVMQADTDGRFTASTDAVLNFGIGARPVWLRFEVVNSGQHAVRRRLSVDGPWLDQLDMFVVSDGGLLDRYRLGDRLPFSDRPVDSRVFSIEQTFGPGHTRVYIRVESIDPMLLPIHLSTAAQAEARQVSASYSYGILYGTILALAAYNLMLFFSLRSRRYLTYTLYLSAFVLMNVAYTGHGVRFLWPDSPQWQQWAIPILMMLVMLLGFLFATTFLDTRKHFPRANRVVIGLCAVAGGAELLAVALGDQLAALLVSFVCVFIYSIGMILLGATSFLAGNKSARYFLIATITHVSTASVTALAVWGFIPYSELAYRSVEIGMMLDAILLAMALADQFRINQVANNAKSRFLAASSHDLRQPLHAIELFVAAFPSARSDGERDDILGKINDSVTDMSTLLTSLLDVSKLDVGAMDINVRAFQLKAVTDKLEAEFALQAKLKGLSFETKIEDVAVKTDRMLLDRVLRNLLDNAVKYTGDGRIEVRTEQVSNNELVITISDTGRGIDASQHEHIFEEYSQLRSSQRDRREGLGLGLAIVRRLCALLGYKLELESVLGQGTSFSLSLPLATEEEVVASTETNRINDWALQGKTAVVIDDEHSVLEAMQALLQGWGCNVITAATVDEVLEALDGISHHPDVIVSDYRLANKQTGIDAIAKIQAKYAEKIPAILITGDTDAEVLERAAQSECVLLNKPVRPAQLRLVLNQVAD